MTPACSWTPTARSTATGRPSSSPTPARGRDCPPGGPQQPLGAAQRGADGRVRRVGGCGPLRSVVSLQRRLGRGRPVRGAGRSAGPPGARRSSAEAGSERAVMHAQCADQHSGRSRAVPRRSRTRGAGGRIAGRDLQSDVASSTNLGGWINKTGVWTSKDRLDWFADDTERVLKWAEVTSGQHIELGIRRGQPGESPGRARRDVVALGERLIPIATLYDPFVSRALEPWSYGIYAGGQSISSGPRRASPWHPRAGRISRSRRRPSAWSSPDASRGSLRSRRTWSGAFLRR